MFISSVNTFIFCSFSIFISSFNFLTYFYLFYNIIFNDSFSSFATFSFYFKFTSTFIFYYFIFDACIYKPEIVYFKTLMMLFKSFICSYCRLFLPNLSLYCCKLSFIFFSFSFFVLVSSTYNWFFYSLNDDSISLSFVISKLFSFNIFELFEACYIIIVICFWYD
jgi:hypothetical protein